MSNTIIRLTNLKFYGFHGVHKIEKTKGTNFEIDLELFYNGLKAKQFDKVHYALNYENVFNIVKSEVVKKKFDLLEALGYTISKKLFKEFTQLKKVNIKIRKMNPLKIKNLKFIEVEITERRSN